MIHTDGENTIANATSNDPTEVESRQKRVGDGPSPGDIRRAQTFAPAVDLHAGVPATNHRAGDFDDFIAGVSIPKTDLDKHSTTLLDALDWYEDDRMECARIEGRDEDESHLDILQGIEEAREWLRSL